MPSSGRVWKKQLSLRSYCEAENENFQTMQHSKSFSQLLRSPQELEQALHLLLQEMHITPQLQFRLIGLGVYQLAAHETETQLLLLYFVQVLDVSLKIRQLCFTF